MTPEEREKIDLDTPAFESPKPEEEVAAPESVDEGVKTGQEPESVEEGNKVPYSRFKKYHDEAKQYQQEAEYWRQQAEASRNKPEREERGQDPLEEARKLWFENYGDTEASRKAWDNQLKISQTLEERAIARAEERAREALRSERQEEERRTQDNIGVIDNELEALEEYVGRPLKENEEEAILDIVDEFTPKNEDGSYSGALLPMDRAWEIYELKQGASKSTKRTSRDSVASLSGNQSQGNSDVQSEQDKNFDPRWGSLDSVIKRRLGG